MTILDAHVFGVSEGKLQEWGYVVMSRHQLDVQLYVVAPEWNEELDRPPRQLAYDPLAELTHSLGESAAKTLATDRRDGDELAMGRTLKTLPPDCLVRAIDTATELLAKRPPSRTGELHALAETRAMVASACRNAAAAMGEGRATPPGGLERLHGRLADLDARQEQLKREHEAYVRWDHDHAPQLRRAQLAGQELLARHDARLVPADAWRNSVAAIERFRAACEIDHAAVALGWEVGGGPQEPHDLIASQVDLTQTPPARHPGIERVDQLAVDL